MYDHRDQHQTYQIAFGMRAIVRVLDTNPTRLDTSSTCLAIAALYLCVVAGSLPAGYVRGAE